MTIAPWGKRVFPLEMALRMFTSKYNLKGNILTKILKILG